LTAEEIQKVIITAQPWLSDVVFFLALTGIRRKEVCCIRWSSVDLGSKTFCIESHEGFHPKGYKPRVIPLSEQALQFLTEKKAEAFKSRRFGLDQSVFLLENGKRIRPQAITCALNRLGKKIGIRNLGPHLLRHSFCSMLVMKNESVEKIRRIAGHANLVTTQRYLTLVPNDLVESMEKASSTLKLSR
jgi:integrase